MLTVDQTVLHDPLRLAAVRQVQRSLAALPHLADTVARVAGCALGAPTALIALVGDRHQDVIGAYRLPFASAGGERTTTDFRAGDHVVSANRSLRSADVLDGDDELRWHPLVTGQGVRSFLSVPIPDGVGRAVGWLAVFDIKVRQWSDDQAALLGEIAGLLRRDVVAAVTPPTGGPGENPMPDSAREAFLTVDRGGVARGWDRAAQESGRTAVERSERFLAALLDSLSVGVIACDAAGQIVLINRALREVQTMPAGAPVPDDYAVTAEAAMVHPDLSPMSWEQTPLMRAMHGERVDASDVLIRAPGQRLRTFATTARPIVGSTGRHLGAVAVAHEVTAIRRTEQFRACHLQVAQVLAATNSPQEAAHGILRAVTGTLGWPYAELWLIDETTGHLHAIGRWSSAGFDAAGLADHPVVEGVGITGRVWSTGKPVWVPDIAEVTAQTPAARAFVEAAKSKGIRTVLAVPVRDGDTLLGVLSCYADAPEPHEDLLTVLLDGVAAQFGVFVALRRAAALAHQLDRAKDDYIALVGHEMRTPLTSIAANIAMLSEDADALSDDHRQMVQAVARNTTVLQDIIDMLLDLAALDAGHLALATSQVDLTEIVVQAIGAVQPAGATSAVRFTTDLPVRVIMTGDPERLRQAIGDLLSNAVTYSPADTDVLVRLRVDDDAAELTIADAGIGVPDHERAYVFDRFYRGSNVRHHGTTGHGLGLSRARTIVDLHGGAITLTGRQPVGTTVRLRLPLRPRATPESP